MYSGMDVFGLIFFALLAIFCFALIGVGFKENDPRAAIGCFIVGFIVSSAVAISFSNIVLGTPANAGRLQPGVVYCKQAEVKVLDSEFYLTWQAGTDKVYGVASGEGEPKPPDGCFMKKNDGTFLKVEAIHPYR